MEFSNGSVKQYLAERDSLHPGGAVVFAKDVKISELSEAKEIKIVAVVSLYNILDYSYTEVDDA